MRPDERRRVAFADGLRGIAALWVVLFHASEGGHVPHLLSALPPWMVTIVFEWGHLGVAVFFVLSGYVMSRSVAGLDTTHRFAGRFFLRRLLRLSPPYYASIGFVILYGAAKGVALGTPADSPGVPNVAAHLVYLQDILAAPAISVVYWTLCIEIQFYLGFVALLVVRRWLQRRGVRSADDLPWLGAVLLAFPWMAGWVETPVFRGSFLPFWSAFVLGLLVGRAQSTRSSTQAAAFAGLMMAAWASTGSGFLGAALGGAALLVLGTLVPWIAAALGSAPLQFLGTVSYSLYLTHNQLSGGAAFALRRIASPSVAGDLLLLVGMLVASLLFAWVCWAVVERPSIALSRRIRLT